jgi:hypothetical protein
LAPTSKNETVSYYSCAGKSVGFVPNINLIYKFRQKVGD